MSGHQTNEENCVGKCLLHNLAEEGALDTEETKMQIRRHGHKGILTMNQEAKMETMTTLKTAYVTPRSPGVRLKGIRCELLEKRAAQMTSEKAHAERNPPTLQTEYSSTSHTDFCVKGFVPRKPETTQVHDYKTDQAITFWSDNFQRIQGMTAAQTSKAPFRKSALFTTPISKRLDEEELPPDS
ncbi:sperm-associated antigen 8 isoform X1 [Embiotoca jacksoni]|uniref:sperm-associated antigen 8 isoform X1 n=2 Tax=Embiotoca jacksoni TaxID=100190 RepID=UPI003703E17E